MQLGGLRCSLYFAPPSADRTKACHLLLILNGNLRKSVVKLQLEERFFAELLIANIFESDIKTQKNREEKDGSREQR